MLHGLYGVLLMLGAFALSYGVHREATGYGRGRRYRDDNSSLQSFVWVIGAVIFGFLALDQFLTGGHTTAQLLSGTCNHGH